MRAGALQRTSQTIRLKRTTKEGGKNPNPNTKEIHMKCLIKIILRIYQRQVPHLPSS